MLIATFGPTTAWVGTQITSEGDTFVLEGHGPISVCDIMEYDRQGHLVWVNDGTRAWVGSRAALSQAAKPAVGAADPPTGGARGPTSGLGSHFAPRTTTYLKRALLLAIAALVVTNAAILLAVAGVFRDSGNTVGAATQTAGPQNPPSATPMSLPSPQTSSWPVRLAGNWVNTLGTEPAKVVISESGGQATVIRTNSDDSTSSWTFAGDILTTTKTENSADGLHTPGARVPTPRGHLRGDCERQHDDDSGERHRRHPQDGREQRARRRRTTETFAIAGDGSTLSHFDSATGVTTTLTRSSVPQPARDPVERLRKASGMGGHAASPCGPTSRRPASLHRELRGVDVCLGIAGQVGGIDVPLVGARLEGDLEAGGLRDVHGDVT